MGSKKETTLGPPDGFLLLHGSGNVDCDYKFKNLFVQLVRKVGGPRASIMYIPTAFGDKPQNSKKHHLDPSYAAERFGLKKAFVLHPREQVVFYKVIE